MMNNSSIINFAGVLYEASDDEDKQRILFKFVTEGILLNLVGVQGIFGNIISMIILSRPQMKSSINYLLIGLARCDTVLIMTSVLLFGIPAIYKYTGYLYVYYFKVRFILFLQPKLLMQRVVHMTSLMKMIKEMDWQEI